MAKSNSEFKSIQKKLVAAVAMVLVASIMVVSSSYAWFTLSTAPEVTGIQTSVGSNGNLEMALRTQKDVSLIGTTTVATTFPRANESWGNLVDLSDSSYHLADVALSPARLNITIDTANSKYSDAEYTLYNVDGTLGGEGKTYNGDAQYDGADITKVTVSTEHNFDDPTTKEVENNLYKYTITTKKQVITRPAYKLNGDATTDIAYLKTPVYGADGRLSALSTDNVINGTYLPDAKGFAAQATGSWGVRAIGTTSNLTPAQMALRTAKRTVSAAITSSKDAAATSLRVDAVKLANILVNTTLTKDYKLTDTDQNDIKKAIQNLQEIAKSLEDAMVQSVIALGVAQGKNLTADMISFTNGKVTITGEDNQLTWSYSLTAMKATLEAAAASLNTMKTDLSGAMTKIDDQKYTEAMAVLLQAEDFRIVSSGDGKVYTVGAIKDMADSAPITAANILLTTPTISIEGGVYHSVALFSGNYSANASMTVSLEYNGINLNDAPINVVVATDADEPRYTYVDNMNTEETDDDKTVTIQAFFLPQVYTLLSSVNVDAGIGGNSYDIITDIYGYAIDLAFRTNAANSNLLLQTEAANRVDDSKLTQGAGSFMQFTKDNQEFTWEQLINLIGSVRVVFISDTGSIYGVAAMQGLTYTPVVVPDTYETEEVTTGEGEEETTVTYHISKDGNSKFEVNDQHTDHTNCKVKTTKPVAYVAGTEGHDMADENGNAVTLTGCTVVTVGEGADAVTYIKAPLKLYGFTVDTDGKMTMGEELAANTLTALQQNVATAITTLVYLDGDTVQNKDVAISGNSMTGTMNLQFASDATLDPMDYSFTTTQLVKPTLAQSGNKITITGDPNTYAYKVFVKVNDGTATDTGKTLPGNTTEIDLTTYIAQIAPDAAAGTQITISLVATSNLSSYTNSAASDGITYTIPGTPANTPTETTTP